MSPKQVDRIVCGKAIRTIRAGSIARPSLRDYEVNESIKLTFEVVHQLKPPSCLEEYISLVSEAYNKHENVYMCHKKYDVHRGRKSLLRPCAIAGSHTNGKSSLSSLSTQYTILTILENGIIKETSRCYCSLEGLKRKCPFKVFLNQKYLYLVHQTLAVLKTHILLKIIRPT